MKRIITSALVAIFAISTATVASAGSAPATTPQDVVSVVKKVSHKTKRGTQTVYTRTKRGGKYVYRKAKKGTKWTYRKVKRGGKWVYVKTRNVIVGKPRRVS